MFARVCTCVADVADKYLNAKSTTLSAFDYLVIAAV